jgi:REP element-mobilizing transposase RayT
MARPLRIEYPGAVYHVITRGNNRQVIFRDDQDRTLYLEKLFHYCREKAVHLLCYCLLSNHIHLLLETPQGNLSRMMQAFQTSYTVSWNRRHRYTGHVFEQRYKAFLVDKDHYLLQVSRYIHLNPVEARIVERPQDYPWSSYRAYLRTRGATELRREFILGHFGGRSQAKINQYREFVEGALQGEETQCELPIVKQTFVGDENFAEQVWQRMTKNHDVAGRYGLAVIRRAVCQVVGIELDDFSRGTKVDHIQRGRELFMYMARRYSAASLQETVRWLGVRDVSTVSHGVRRAERRLKQEELFRQQLEETLRNLIHSHIQA